MTLKIGMFRSPLVPWVAFPIEIFFSNPNMLSSMLLMALTLVVKTNNMRLNIPLFISNTPNRLWTARLNSFNSFLKQQWTVAGFCGLWPQILRPSGFYLSSLPGCPGVRLGLTWPPPLVIGENGVRVGAETILLIRSITASASTTTTATTSATLVFGHLYTIFETFMR